MRVNAVRDGLAALMLGALLVLTGFYLPVSFADPSTKISVELTSITPTAISDTGNLSIRGKATNVTGRSLSSLVVKLWRDATPITSSETLERINASPEHGGEAMRSDTAVQKLGENGTLNAGESSEFTVSADMGPNDGEQLWLNNPEAVYQVGVQIFAGADLLATSTSFISYPGQTKVTIGTIVLLNARPSLLPLESADSKLNVFSDDSLPRELAGRLDELMKLAEQSDVTTMIDPLLYDEVVALSLPHAHLAADGTLSSADENDRELAQNWLGRLDHLLSNGHTYRTIYGSVDVASAIASGSEDLVAKAAALPPGHPLAQLPLMVLPYKGQLSQESLTALADLSPQYILAGNSTDSFVSSQYGQTTVLSVDSASLGTRLADRGLLLARELLRQANKMPSIEIVSTTEGASLAAEHSTWRSQQDIGRLVRSYPVSESAGWPEPAHGDQRMADEIASSQPVLNTWSEARMDPSKSPSKPSMTFDPAISVLASTWSTSFDRHTDDQIAWLDQATQEGSSLAHGEGVQLRVSNWVTTSSEDNLLPVTVVNSTSRRITVRVHFESDNPLRITVDDSDLVSVEPGESATTRVRPFAMSNGTVGMRAQLVTSSGYPIGTPVVFSATSTNAGRVAWIIVVASGLVLLATTAHRVRSMHRGNREDDAHGE